MPVLAMPFDDEGVIDEDAMRRQLDFCVEAGSQAVAFGMGSESAVLTDSEKRRMWSLAARHVDGRVPVIAATAHASRPGTLEHTAIARDCGVDLAMVNPDRQGGDDLVRLFRDLSEQVGLPLMVQDAGGNAPAEVLLKAVDEAPRVTCLKLESQGAPDKIGALVDGLRERGLLGGGPRELTVLGGGNGNWLPEELDRGSVGSMPHPALIDSFRTVCDHYAAGDPEGGRQAYHGIVAPGAADPHRRRRLSPVAAQDPLRAGRHLPQRLQPPRRLGPARLAYGAGHGPHRGPRLRHLPADRRPGLAG